MSTSIKTDKSKTFTMVGMGIMILLVLTKIVPTLQLADYSGLMSAGLGVQWPDGQL